MEQRQNAKQTAQEHRFQTKSHGRHFVIASQRIFLKCITDESFPAIVLKVDNVDNSFPRKEGNVSIHA